MVVVGFDVAHRRRDVGVIQQVFGEMDVSLRLLHQVCGERMSETMRRHAYAELIDQFFVHRLDLVGLHNRAFVMPRESIDIEQLIFGLETSAIRFV